VTRASRGYVAAVLEGRTEPARLTLSAMVKFTCSEDAFGKLIEKLGGGIAATVGDIAAVSIPLNSLEALEKEPGVAFIEASRPLRRSVDESVDGSVDGSVDESVDESVSQIGANQWHAPSIGLDGKGVIIGVIDLEGPDFHHPDFRNKDDSTRLLYLLNQEAEGDGYSASVINQDLQSATPYSIVNQIPRTRATARMWWGSRQAMASTTTVTSA
jgi:hypothetical protein